MRQDKTNIPLEMTPVWFPYTYLPPELAAAAANWFPRLSVYQPAADQLPPELDSWAACGFLDVRVPVPEGGERIAAAVGEYRQWAHLRGRRDLKTALPPGVAEGRPPFFDDTASAQILAELKGGVPQESKEAQRLFRARMFLCLAQDLDRQNCELRRRLKGVLADSRAMLEGLRPEADREAAVVTSPLGDTLDDVSDYMLTERLSAWAQLFLRDTPNTAVLLTSSRRLLADLLASCENSRLLKPAHAGGLTTAAEVPVGAADRTLLRNLTDLCMQPEPVLPAGLGPLRPPEAGTAPADHFSLHLIPDRSPVDLISGWTSVQASPTPTSGSTRTGEVFRHTVVGGLFFGN